MASPVPVPSCANEVLSESPAGFARRWITPPNVEGLSDDEVWQEVQRRKGGVAPTTVGIREAEIKTLLSSPDTVGTDQPDGLFYARTIVTPSGEPALTSKLSRIVKVHRLREVITQILRASKRPSPT